MAITLWPQICDVTSPYVYLVSLCFAHLSCLFGNWTDRQETTYSLEASTTMVFASTAANSALTISNVSRSAVSSSSTWSTLWISPTSSRLLSLNDLSAVLHVNMMQPLETTGWAKSNTMCDKQWYFHTVSNSNKYFRESNFCTAIMLNILILWYISRNWDESLSSATVCNMIWL